MDKLNLQTPDLTTENVKRIQQLFPSCVTESEDSEGNIVYKVDFDLLRAELGDKSVTEGLEERYRLDWPGKKRSILKANTPINKTLRPVKNDSVDWDNTGNLCIEGDNFEVLKILQESYLGKIKMIYIDPPYNTGKDFIYNDNFSENSEEYKERTEENGEGYKMVRNLETNGRFHSDWLSMMYERLKVARDLLTDDGIIFISIDDNEQDNLRKICDEIFGDRNFVANIIRQKKFSPQNDAKWFSDNHDFILCYSKNKDVYRPYLLERSEESNARYKNPDNDPRGPRASSDLSVKTYSANYDYPIVTPSGKEVSLPEGRCWMTSKENMKKLIDDNRIWFGESGENLPRLKRFLSEVKQGITPLTVWLRDEVGDTQEAKRELLGLMPENIFQTPKPTRLIDKMLKLSVVDGDIVLDFFSGSATTAHSVMKSDKKLKYIMVQNSEPTGRDDYKTLFEVGTERIRRAAKKIKEETGADIDYGFRVYRVDDSCLKDVDNHPSEIKQEDLFNNISNIKEDRTPEDLLTQVILSLGLTLDLPIEEKTIKNNKVFYVAGNSLVACFDENIDFGIVEEIAKDQPLKLVFRDASFRTDADRINVENTMKRLSENTIVKVI